MLFMNWDPIPNSKYHQSQYQISTYIPQITMMSVQKRMIPKGYLIRLVVLPAVPNCGKLRQTLVRGVTSENEFWEF